MTTNIISNNVIPIHQALKNAEDEAIAEALAHGHHDPWSDPGISKSLEFEWNGKIFRRYIAKFECISVSRLQYNQVRKEVICNAYCIDELAPLIKKDGRINNPIMITQLNVIMHGHNRAYSAQHIWGSTVKVPAFILSPELYEVVGGGKYVLVPPARAKSLYKISSIKVNPKAPNKGYTMECVATQIKQLEAIDPTFEGVLSTRKPATLLDRKDFDKVMDDLHPMQFLLKAIRTKIYNKVIKGNPLNQIKIIDEAVILSSMNKAGWNPQIKISKKSQSRSCRPFLENYDARNKMLIMVMNNEGRDFERSIEKIFYTKKKDLDPDGYGIIEVGLAAHIKNPKDSFVELQKQRDAFEARIEEYNNVLALHGRNIKITKVLFLSQLTQGVSDPDTIRLIK